MTIDPIVLVVGVLAFLGLVLLAILAGMGLDAWRRYVQRWEFSDARRRLDRVTEFNLGRRP